MIKVLKYCWSKFESYFARAINTNVETAKKPGSETLTFYTRLHFSKDISFPRSSKEAGTSGMQLTAEKGASLVQRGFNLKF